MKNSFLIIILFLMTSILNAQPLSSLEGASGMPACLQNTPPSTWTNCYGKVRYSNGDTYEGSFLDGKKHGVGRYVVESTKYIYEGGFEKDKLNGTVTLISTDGRREQLNFREGQRVAEQNKSNQVDQIIATTVFYINNPEQRGFNRAKSANDQVPFCNGLRKYEKHYQDRWYPVYCANAFQHKDGKIRRVGNVYSLIYSTGDYSVHKRFDGHFRLEFHCNKSLSPSYIQVFPRLLFTDITRQYPTFLSTAYLELDNQTILENFLATQQEASPLDYPGTTNAIAVFNDIDRRNKIQQQQKSLIPPYKILGKNNFEFIFSDMFTVSENKNLHSSIGVNDEFKSKIINILKNETSVRGATLIINNGPKQFGSYEQDKLGPLIVRLDIDEIRNDYAGLEKLCN
jgi:hypothetical protein